MLSPLVIRQSKLDDVRPERLLQIGIDSPSDDWFHRLGSGFDWCQESIAALRHCLNVERILGAVSERVANLLDREVHALIEVNEGIAGPQGRLDFLAGHQVAGSIREQTEQPKGLGLDPDRPTTLEQPFGLEIELKGTEASHAPRPSIHKVARLLGS